METTIAGAPAPMRHDIRFEGSGGEYFKIWIVNLALTIATLGIFSAWAKVRNKRYFCGNTFIAGHSFDYHGLPIRILIGRLIALGLLLAYTVSTTLVPMAGLVWVPLFILAAPWLIVASLRFNARNTSYRNIRFNFHGTYWGAVKAFILWPLLAAITLGTTMPLAHRARLYFQINSHSFGDKPFETAIPGGRMYLIYLMTFGVLVGVVAVIGILFAMTGISMPQLGAENAPPEPTPGMIGLFLLIALAYGFGILFIVAFLHAMTFNLAVSNTRLGGEFSLEAKLSPLAMMWILVSNTFLVVITLGLFSPWAHVRQTRYIAEHIAISGPRSVDNFIDSAPRQAGAIGEEVAGFFDFDFSL